MGVSVISAYLKTSPIFLVNLPNILFATDTTRKMSRHFKGKCLTQIRAVYWGMVSQGHKEKYNRWDHNNYEFN